VRVRTGSERGWGWRAPPFDVKQRGRIPAGGGHRIHGRERAPRGRGLGDDYLHVAVDDHSRLAFVRAYPDEQSSSAAACLTEAAACFAAQGVAIERVLTDNAGAFTHGRAFRQALAALGVQHRRTWSDRPQRSGSH
jgi:hypothetical protein